ncbi:Pantothenate synthetase [Nitrospira sp. KM1]|uniref:pantoate--beta-alanine ligase n=1 Tax=Nitrospira sp. KM1 TaxID=1936990 RepID=UPI0013A79DDA|nr:pantoate--beta-alanine ligase [Nitrospira sp. KM1]BCA55644.1 Pantothenate synthetase [Nitrospira sp. KM1]
MKIIRLPHAMSRWSDRLRREGVTIGLVPTMGALHDGHRALIKAARLQCDALVVSIFVNPTQFSPNEDLSRYPRPIAKDRALCRGEGVDVCFEPDAGAMYPEGFQTIVTVPVVAQHWEGASRPHHFAGVATVVTKLFSIVRPHVTLFGQKDFQQAALIRRLIRDLNLGIDLIVPDTIREPDGLAMSSRNIYLTPFQRRAAPTFHQALLIGRTAVETGLRDSRSIEQRMRHVIGREPTMSVDYLAICDPETLEPLTRIERRAVILGAVRIGSVRLLDNMMVAVKPRR